MFAAFKQNGIFATVIDGAAFLTWAVVMALVIWCFT